MAKMSEETFKQIQALPPEMQKLVMEGYAKNLHTSISKTFGQGRNQVTVNAKVGERGTVVVVTVNGIQGYRPSIQLRPKSILALREFGGSLFAWLGSYVDEQVRNGALTLVDEGADKA